MSTERSRGLSRYGLAPEILVTNNMLVFIESIIVLLVVWTAVSYGFDLTDTISAPTMVAAELYSLVESGIWVEHFLATMRRIVYAFALTVVVGTSVGVLMGMSDFWTKALQDYITVGVAIPSLFAAIFAAMWFGQSDITPMVAGAIISFPFLTQNVYEGVKNVDYELQKMSQAFNVSQPRMIRRVILQSVLPEWFAGARYAFALCWKITTLAELIAASNGIGFMIEYQMERLSLTGVLAWTILFTVVIVFVEYGVFQQIEKRAFAWRENTTIGFQP